MELCGNFSDWLAGGTACYFDITHWDLTPIIMSVTLPAYTAC
jgi:hypothetical protein